MNVEKKPIQTYPDQERMKRLVDEFHTLFGHGCQQVVRVPGRVNLIGEHIDYCGYAVLPMAVEQDVLIAFTKSPENLDLRNLDAARYPPFRLALRRNRIQITPGEVSWWNYFLCGLQGMLDFSGQEYMDCGLECLVDGTIPPRAGLSSSSAMVVAAAICVSLVNNVDISRKSLADLCAASERYIGTQGGGMDQAIEILASRGTAKLIEFNPLETFDVKLPDAATFVITNSLAESNKAAGCDYNARVAECRLASKVLAKSLAMENWSNCLKLGDMQRASGLSLDQMVGKVEEILHLQPYTKSELCKILAMRDEELNLQCLSQNTIQMNEFHLRHRALHVFTEARRVYEFRAVCEADSDSSLRRLGELMRKSHESCSRDYECSHPKLDRLVELSIKHGAMGARLTGAGWGGCIVALVPQDRVEQYIDGIKSDYFSDLDAAAGQDLQNFIFASQPGDGARIFYP